jgi:hypothetical protein
MGAKIDLENKRFGRWLVVGKSVSKRVGPKQKIVVFWPCVCDCGTGKDDPIYVDGTALRATSSGSKSRSCGCLRHEKVYRSKPKNCKKNDNTSKKLSSMDNTQYTSLTKKSYGELTKYCKKCRRPLNSYNDTGQCYSHSVEDKYQNMPWQPNGHGAEIHSTETKPVSEWATTSISAAAGRY